MPRLIITVGAARGLERCRQYLFVKKPQASKRAGQAIERQFSFLAANPEVGRPLKDIPEIRELVIGFGDSGYVALYRQAEEEIVVLVFRHQKEAGYSS